MEQLEYPEAEIKVAVPAGSPAQLRLHPKEKEPWTVEWIHNYVEPGDILWDVGANTGVFALIAALAPQVSARVVAWEPAYPTYANLCENVILNDAEGKILPLSLALSNVTKLGTFELKSTAVGDSFHVMSEGHHRYRNHSVRYRQPVLRIRADDAIAKFAVPAPNHMLIDVDGGEALVLSGASKTLRSAGLTSILIEVADVLHDEVERMLSRAGFTRVAHYRRHEKVSVEWSYQLFLRRTHGPALEDEGPIRKRRWRNRLRFGLFS